jgi:hypothetical protein
MQGHHTMGGQIHTELGSTVMQINAGTPHVGRTNSLSDSVSTVMQGLHTMGEQIHTELGSTVMQINAGTPHDGQTHKDRARQHGNADQCRDSTRWADKFSFRFGQRGNAEQCKDTHMMVF